MNIGSSPPPRAEIEAKPFPRTQSDRPLAVLQHPRVSFNEANGDVTKHPAAFIRQEGSRGGGALAARLSSRASSFPLVPRPPLRDDFPRVLVEVEVGEMSQSVARMLGKCHGYGRNRMRIWRKLEGD